MYPSRITLNQKKWYGWEMLPGYVDTPYFSPIYIESVEPQKTGLSILRLRFWNIGYAQGVQDFEIEMNVALRGGTFMLGQLLEYNPVRGAVITELSAEWLINCCPWILGKEYNLHDADLQEYLSGIFKNHSFL